ncbi:MAG: hypothetical protein WDO15_06045 [Bacteroidota bacterium]
MKKKTIIIIVILVIVALGILTYIFRFDLNYDWKLAVEAEDANKEFPHMITMEYRIDSIRVGTNPRTWHVYDSFVTEAVDPNFCDDWEEEWIDHAKWRLGDYGSHGVTLMYSIYYKNGELACTVTLPPEKYYNVK